MARSPKRKASDAGPVLPPGTYIVDNPEWDKAAPNLDLAESPKRPAKRPAPAAAPARAPAKRGTAVVTMSLLALVSVAVVGFGVWRLLEREDGEHRASAEAETEAETEAEAKAPPPLVLEDPEVTYLRRVAATAAALGVEAPSLDTLRAPNSFSNPATHGSPVVIAPGGSKRLGELSFKVRTDTLSLQRRGIRSKGQHTMLVVTNPTEHPLAYRLIVRKASVGECHSPVVFNYDAMVIDAGASYEVSVCSGRQSAEIIDLRMLSLTEVGARWIRQLPPLAVGNDAMAARSHELADEDTPQCNEDATEIARSLSENLVKWEDVIDFYSRHDCQHYAWASEYRLASQALTELPILPEQDPPAEP